MAAEVRVVVVGIMRTLRVELSVVVVHGILFIHRPEKPQDEHDHPQHHATEGESLQAVVGGGHKGRGPSGHYEEDSDKDCSVVQGRHPPPGLEVFLALL